MAATRKSLDFFATRSLGLFRVHQRSVAVGFSWSLARNYSSGYGENGKRLQAREVMPSLPISPLLVKVFLRQGFPVLSLPLPSRHEVCEFTLRPYLQTVGTLLKDIKVTAISYPSLSPSTSSSVRRWRYRSHDDLFRRWTASFTVNWAGRIAARRL